MALELNDGNFDTEVLEASETVLIDFWSPTWGPCRKLGPVIDELATQNEGKAKVAKLDVSGNMTLAAKYKISMLPTIVVVKGGEVVNTHVGLASLDQLQGMIDDA